VHKGEDSAGHRIPPSDGAIEASEAVEHILAVPLCCSAVLGRRLWNGATIDADRAMVPFLLQGSILMGSLIGPIVGDAASDRTGRRLWNGPTIDAERAMVPFLLEGSMLMGWLIWQMRLMIVAKVTILAKAEKRGARGEIWGLSVFYFPRNRKWFFRPRSRWPFQPAFFKTAIEHRLPSSWFGRYDT